MRTRGADRVRPCATCAGPAPAGPVAGHILHRLQRSLGNRAVGRLLRARQGSPDAEAVPDAVRDVLRSSGRPLGADVRAPMEEHFGRDFGDVRIHTDSRAAASAAAVRAHAYTAGTHVVFNAGRYQPGSAAGRRLLAHELAHVVQQGGRAPDLQRLTLDDPSGDALERGAERAADAVARGTGARHAGVDGGAVLRRETMIEEPAGGCGVCQGPAAAGRVAHQLIQLEFETWNPLALSELPVPGGALRPDVVVATPTGLKIGEIKPAHAAGYTAGAAKIAAYVSAFRAAYPASRIEPLDLTLPRDVTVFPNPQAPACYQELFVNPPAGGVYGYYCEPPFSRLVGRPGCRCGPRVPEPAPAPHERTSTDEKKRPVRPGGPDMVPAPVTNPPLQLVADFIGRVIKTGADVEGATRDFLATHPEVINVLIGAAAATMVATLIEDIATAGVGLIDDPVILTVCYRVIAIAHSVRAASPVR